MSVETELTITCDGCGDSFLDEGSKIYCEDCYDRLQSTIETLEAEVEDLRQELVEMLQENEDLRDNT